MDIKIKGIPFSKTVVITNGQEISDISGFSEVTIKVRKIGSASLLKSFSLSTGTLTQVLPSTSGKVTFSLSASDTGSAKAGAYQCEVTTTVAGQDPERAIIYAFILEEPYT